MNELVNLSKYINAPYINALFVLLTKSKMSSPMLPRIPAKRTRTTAEERQNIQRMLLENVKKFNLRTSRSAIPSLPIQSTLSSSGVPVTTDDDDDDLVFFNEEYDDAATDIPDFVMDSFDTEGS